MRILNVGENNEAVRDVTGLRVNEISGRIPFNIYEHGEQER